MPACTTLSSLIADIHDAALDRRRWRDVLGAVATYIGASCAGLWIRHPDCLPSEEFFFGGEDDCIEVLAAQLRRSSVLSDDGQAADDGASTDHTAAPSAKLLKTQLCNGAASASRESADSAASFTVFRADGAWDDLAMRHMRLVVPHMRRAVQIGQSLNSKRAAAASLADMLDGLSASVFLLDADGEVVHANENGRIELAEGQLLRSVHGKLAAIEPRANANFAQALALKQADAPRFTLEDAAYDASNSSTASCHMAHMFPIRAGAARERGCESSVVAGLVLDKTIFDADDPVHRMAQHFGLGRREREVLHAIVEGNGLTTVAEILAISQGTLKTHLSRLFEKTGTKRQLELIKLCAAFRSPFREHSSERRRSDRPACRADLRCRA